MNISLSPEQEKFIDLQIKSGGYSSPDEVIAQALQLLEENYNLSVKQRLEELREKIASANEQIANGQLTDGEIVCAKIQEKIRLLSAKAQLKA
jgi:antitoxin ParD1/3/4